MSATPFPTVGDLQDALVTLLVKARGRVEREVDAILKGEGVKLTFTHWCVLRELSASKGIPMGELHRAASVNDSTLTKIIDLLVSRGLAFRVPDTEDRRRVLICRSKNGTALLDRLKGKINDRQKTFIPGGDLNKLSEVVQYLSDLAA